jgi:hypothetical protein
MNTMRYAAPADVSGITLSIGPLTVTNGFVEVPDDASPGDLGGLAVYGFVAAPDTTPTRAPSKTQSAPSSPDASPDTPTE